MRQETGIDRFIDALVKVYGLDVADLDESIEVIVNTPKTSKQLLRKPPPV